jgi:hypothetical protein
MCGLTRAKWNLLNYFAILKYFYCLKIVALFFAYLSAIDVTSMDGLRVAHSADWDSLAWMAMAFAKRFLCSSTDHIL